MGYMPPPKSGAFQPVQPCHAKTWGGPNGHMPETPIGKGGKMDDTSVVVAEVIEWTEAHSEVWAQVQRQRDWNKVVTCGGTFKAPCRSCGVDEDEVDNFEEIPFNQHNQQQPR